MTTSHRVVGLLITEICQEFGKISENRKGEGVPSGDWDSQALFLSLLAPSVSWGPEGLKRTGPNSSLAISSYRSAGSQQSAEENGAQTPLKLICTRRVIN